MSELQNAYTFLPFFFLGKWREFTSFLIVTDHPEREAIDYGMLNQHVSLTSPDFSTLLTSDGTGEPLQVGTFAHYARGHMLFDNVILDVENSDMAGVIKKATRLLAGDGRLIVLDWEFSTLKTLRNLRHHLSEARPIGGTDAVLAALKAHQLEVETYLLAEPGLHKPRHLVSTGFKTRIPAASTSAARRWLIRQGGFYLQPKHRLIVARKSGDPGAEATSFINQVLGKLCHTPPASALQAHIRQWYISTSNVFLLSTEVAGQECFVRIPFTGEARGRFANQNAIITLLHEQHIEVAPRPYPMEIENTAIYAESGMPGENIDSRFGKMDLDVARRYVAAAIKKIALIHLHFGEFTTYSTAVFEAHIQPRLDIVVEKLPAYREAITEAGRYLHRELSSKRVLLTLCHGDLKIGNCLFDREGNASGLIDWDMGERKAPALIDAASLLGRSLRQRHRFSLHELVMHASRLEPDFAEEMEYYFRETHTDPLDIKAVLLLYWLDRVYKQIAFDTHLKKSWLSRNAVSVLKDLKVS